MFLREEKESERKSKDFSSKSRSHADIGCGEGGPNLVCEERMFGVEAQGLPTEGVGARGGPLSVRKRENFSFSPENDREEGKTTHEHKSHKGGSKESLSEPVERDARESDRKKER